MAVFARQSRGSTELWLGTWRFLQLESSSQQDSFRNLLVLVAIHRFWINIPFCVLPQLLHVLQAVDCCDIAVHRAQASCVFLWPSEAVGPWPWVDKIFMHRKFLCFLSLLSPPHKMLFLHSRVYLFGFFGPCSLYAHGSFDTASRLRKPAFTLQIASSSSDPRRITSVSISIRLLLMSWITGRQSASNFSGQPMSEHRVPALAWDMVHFGLLLFFLSRVTNPSLQVACHDGDISTEILWIGVSVHTACYSGLPTMTALEYRHTVRFKVQCILLWRALLPMRCLSWRAFISTAPFGRLGPVQLASVFGRCPVSAAHRSGGGSGISASNFDPRTK